MQIKRRTSLNARQPVRSLNLDEEYNKVLHRFVLQSPSQSQQKLHHNHPRRRARNCRKTAPRITSQPSGNFHRQLNTLLFDFFSITSQGSTACVALLSSIAIARSLHCSLCNVLHSPSSAFSLLSSHLDHLDNPLSPKTLVHFHLIHSHFPTLIIRLASPCRKTSRRSKLIPYAEKASCIGIVGAMVGGWSRVEKAKARVEVAVRRAYIVGRELDTMSRMVRRVHDELDHGREVARMAERSGEWGMVVREVVKGMEGRSGLGLWSEEKLEELEEHVYLCLIAINRSRRLVVEEMQEV